MKSLIICANVLLFIVASALMWIALDTFDKTTALLSPEAVVIFACIQVPFFLFVFSAFNLYFSIQKYVRGKTDKKFKEFFPIYFNSVRLSVVLFLGLVIVFKLKHIFFDSVPEISLHNIEELSVWGWSVGFYAILMVYICPDLKYLIKKKTSAETTYPKYIRASRLARWSCFVLSVTLLYWSGIFTLAYFAEMPAFSSDKGLLPFWYAATWVITLLIAPIGLMVWVGYIKIGSNYIDQFSLLQKNNVISFENITDTIYETMEMRIGGFLRTYYNFQFTLKDGSIIKRSYGELSGTTILKELKLHKQLNIHESHVTREKERKLIKYANYLSAALATALIIYKICKNLSH